MLYNNVLFIQLNPDKLYDITYPTIPEEAFEGEKEIKKEEKEESDVNHDINMSEMDEHKLLTSPEIPLSQNNATGVTQKCDRGHIKKGEGSQNFVTRNTKNTTENITKTKSSSKKGQGNSPPNDDDEGLLKEKLNYNHVSKVCPDVLVCEVFQEIKKLDKELLVQIDAEMFLKICENINVFSSKDITNIPAYIRTCINNLIAAKKISENCSHKAGRDRNNRFNQFQQRDDYDFELLEKELFCN